MIIFQEPNPEICEFTLSFLFLLLFFFPLLYYSFFSPPLPSLKGLPWPWVLSALPAFKGPEASGGITVGLCGAEVRGRGPQRRRTLHVFVPLRSVHLRRPKMTGD